MDAVTSDELAPIALCASDGLAEGGLAVSFGVESQDRCLRAFAIRSRAPAYRAYLKPERAWLARAAVG